LSSPGMGRTVPGAKTLRAPMMSTTALHATETALTCWGGDIFEMRCVG
jgi:hypothetical protein